MKYIAPESTLTLEVLEEIQPKIENVPEIFRYFNTEEDRDNFMAGNLHFSTPTKNRFLQESHHGISDPWEYRNKLSSFLFEESLSFSYEYLDDSKPNIKVIDVAGFINTIAVSLRNSGHKILWVTAKEYEKLLKSQEFVKILNNSDIKHGDLKSIKDVSLSIVGIGGRVLRYDDKIIAENDPRLKEYSSENIVCNAIDQNDTFRDENEYRIHINTSDFFSNNKFNELPFGLRHLAKYIVLFCPEISKYCEKI